MINNTVKVQRERLAAPTSQALLTAQLDPLPRCANRLGLRSLHHCFHIYLYWWGTFAHVRPLCKVQNIWCWEKCVWSSFFIHPSDNSRDSCAKVVSSPPTMYLNRLKQTSSKCHLTLSLSFWSARMLLYIWTAVKLDHCSGHYTRF